MKTPWITFKYYGQLSPRPYPFKTRINADGSLSQVVNVVKYLLPVDGRPIPLDRKKRLTAQLSPRQVNKLRRLIAAVDFEALQVVVSPFLATDAPVTILEIREGKAEFGFDGQLGMAALFQECKKTRENIGRAIRLVNEIDAMMPYGSHSPEDYE